MKRERDIKVDILRAIGMRRDLMVWNNPTGVARSMDGTRVISYGCPGSPDIIGVRAIVITPEMVGQTVGLAIGIEVKTERGRLSEQQKAFRYRFEQVGGVYIDARNPAHVLKVLA